MCGIAGTVGSLPLNGSARGVLKHRGPDDCGSWNDDLLHLLSWRLAVIDLSAAGHQPMVSGCRRYVIAFNGEIYNLTELREEIASARRAQTAEFVWQGHCDTEVVLEGFAAWGTEILPRLNGMFGLAIYDRAEKELYLVRDRAGIKPLYIWKGDRRLAFASEAKFFFTLAEFVPEINPKGLASYFLYGHGCGHFRLLQDVRQLDPGECLRINCKTGSRSSHRFNQFCQSGVTGPKQNARSGIEFAAKRLREVLTHAVERQLIADVPVGVFLSGGIDSSILTALSAKVLGPGNTKAFTLYYEGSGADYNEKEEAREVARHLGVRHHVYQATSQDLIANLERMVWHYDEPFGDAAALNIMILSEHVRKEVTVALAGEGSDELFGGYRRYRVEKLIRALEPVSSLAQRGIRVTNANRIPKLPRRLAIFLRSLSHHRASRRYSEYLESGVDLTELIRPDWQTDFDPRYRLDELYPDNLNGRSTVASLCLADQKFWLVDTYLEKSDKGSMAHSLEVRVPFLDNEVVEFANSLPDNLRVRSGRGKWILRQAFESMLPAVVFARKKRGFAVPISQWLRGDLKSYFVDRVLGDGSLSNEYLNLSTVRRFFDEHQKYVADRSLILWYVLLFETWLRFVQGGFTKPVSRFLPEAMLVE